MARVRTTGRKCESGGAFNCVNVDCDYDGERKCRFNGFRHDHADDDYNPIHRVYFIVERSCDGDCTRRRVDSKWHGNAGATFGIS